MSIQVNCREAIASLSESGATFTEIDVANRASSGKGWGGKQFERARKDAYNALTADYRKGRLVRYGPVQFQKDVDDYARKATKIVYAHPVKGPEFWETPNGRFGRLFADKDQIAAAGRRPGTVRDDTKPWKMQRSNPNCVQDKRWAAAAEFVDAATKGPPVDTAPLMKKIEQQQAEINRLKKLAPGSPGSTHTDGNGSQTEKEAITLSVTINQLAKILEEELTEKVVERATEEVREALAEKLIA